MHSRFFNRVQQQWLISILLVALAVRALIPAGFMPSADQPFTLEICPDGFPAQLLHTTAGGSPSSEHGMPAMLGEHAAHHAHAGSADAAQTGPASQEHGSHEHGSVRAEHCVFAAVASVGPPPQLALLLTPFVAQAAPHLDPDLPLIELTRYRVQQPRGPPLLS